MKTNVQPGMLARITRLNKPIKGAMNDPQLLDRIVFVERAYKNFDLIHTLEGKIVRSNVPFTEPVWFVSARTQLPILFNDGTGIQRFTAYEIPIFDAALRPIVDPDTDVSDEEVKELYSTKEKEVA